MAPAVWHRAGGGAGTQGTGQTPNAPLDAGYQHAVASIMATMSCETGRRARFDKARRTITTD